MDMNKAILIGRHKLLPAQEKALRALGIQIVEQVPEVRDVADVVRKCVEYGAKYIVVQALPIHILSQLLIVAHKNGIKVLVFKMELIFTGGKEEAEQIYKRAPDRRTLLPGRTEESWRVVEFRGIYEVKEIRIVEEPVYLLDNEDTVVVEEVE